MGSHSPVFGKSPKKEQASVQFYVSDEARIRDIAMYLTDEMQADECILLLCATESRDRVMEALGDRFSNADLKRIHFFDSKWAFENILVDGIISRDLFLTHIGTKIHALAQNHRHLRVYSDVGDVLATQGNGQAVLDLEIEWHKALEEVEFRLHCGYMMENFGLFESAAFNTAEPLPTFSLQAAVLQSIDLLVMRLIKTKIHFNVKLHPSQEQLLLRGSSVGIEQVVLNLVSNSIESILEKRRSIENPDAIGNISISLLRTGPGTADLIVEDDGIGITDANESRIFKPFFQTKADPSEAILGLSLSEKAVAHHGGQLTCETIPGESATFTCTLPVTVL